MANYEGRIYLTWDEAAEVLGLDSEGLRQALAHQLSPTEGDGASDWLPVVLPADGDGFRAYLQYRSREPAFSWSGRDTFYKNVSHKRNLPFSDGSELSLDGVAGKDGWWATHGDDEGYLLPFAVRGDTLTASPKSVRDACLAHGYVGSLCVAPRNWCKDGFPFDFSFVVLKSNNTVSIQKPENLFLAARFMREDVMRIRDARNGKIGAPAVSDKPMNTRERNNLLRIIAALAKEAGIDISEGGRGAVTIEAAIVAANFDSPKEQAIRSVLKQVRELSQ